MFVSYGNQNEEDDEDGHPAIFEVKFDKKAEGVTTESRERTAESLFDNLESVALAVEVSDKDIKEKQLVARSGLPILRCCV